VERVLKGELDRYELEKRYLKPDGSIVWGLLCVSLVRGPEREPVHFVAQIQDISVRKEAEQELRRYSDHLTELALQDPLTGLRNYRDFHAALDREIERARRHGGSLSVVLVDVEGLAQINRTRGHVEGDHVLREVGRAVAGVCRACDLAARVGGDKLALVLPETSEQGAEEVTERARRAVAEVEEELSLSHGIACWPAAGDSKELLLRRADVALHIAKPSRAHRDTDRDGLSSEVRVRVERVLALARDQLHMDVAFLGELVDRREVLRAVHGDGTGFGLQTGTQLPLPETLCDRMLDGRIPSFVADSSTEPEIAGLAPVRNGAGIGYVGVPLRFPDGRLYGALCALSARPRPDLSEREAELMRFLAGIVGELLDHSEAEAREHRAELELSGIRALVAALEARDHYTGEHSRTVVRLATAVAERLGLSRREVLEAEQVAMLHDIGKVGIPDSVLQKRGALTREEWQLMLQHPAVGERIVASTDSLSHLAPAVRAEHERFDGTGYPDGLKREEIPIASRITFVCDAYHAMTSDRPYRAAMSATEAEREVEANAGTQFDPLVVRALRAVLDEERGGGAQPPALIARGAIPAAEPRTSSGSATVLGEVRRRCRSCGTHVTATLSPGSQGGSCSNCGSYELEPVED
jgi:diguanylate cyclase (GGDEF)-like protein